MQLAPNRLRLSAEGPMRVTLVVAALGVLASGAAFAAEEPPPHKLEHPGVVALVDDPAGWTYRHFPTGLRLYVYDRDTPGTSHCNAGCASVWPPLLAADDAAAVGDWTVIAREDGRRQWAYRSKPVYVRYHDSTTAPQGDGVDGVWHFLRP
jgi:predicted lipoprotein with Yx(FWY)xxD motif